MIFLVNGQAQALDVFCAVGSTREVDGIFFEHPQMTCEWCLKSAQMIWTNQNLSQAIGTNHYSFRIRTYILELNRSSIYRNLTFIIAESQCFNVRTSSFFQRKSGLLLFGGITLRCHRTFLEVVEPEGIDVGSSRRHSCSGLEGLQQAAWLAATGGRCTLWWFNSAIENCHL